MNQKAQGAFEYVLLLAGIILIAVIAILILRNSVLPSANAQLQTSTAQYRNSVNFTCNSTGCYNSTGLIQ